MAKSKRSASSVEIDLTEATATADRLCRLMGWPRSRRNVMEIWRATGKGQALAISLAKATELADEIERLRGIVDPVDQSPAEVAARIWHRLNKRGLPKRKVSPGV
jgi:hypothetical protein